MTTHDASRHHAPIDDDVAIIGMACMFPGAPDLPTFWHNILRKTDATSDPPPEAWDADVFYDRDGGANDRVYCKRGGFLGPLANFDPLRHGIMPSALDGSEPDQWLALEVARAAFADAGYPQDIPERHRTAVILGKGTYLNRGNLTAAQHGQVVDQTVAIIRSLHPDWTEREMATLRDELKRGLPPFNANTAQGLIPNVTVGRIANRLDLMGPSYTIDAACASSLVAMDIARNDLLTGRADLALVGGIHVVTPVPVLMLFCHLGALSRNERIRPFDEQADGTLLSEGVGMAVVKRLRDAQRDGDRIYAVVKGVGVASDGRALSVLAPRIDGEELALRRAYEQACVSPATVGLIEAHGTATLVGDATEIQALRRVMGDRATALPACALGTVKSMIGHTMPAAGMAGLIKSALALYHRTLPPTINVDQPSPRLELDQTPFYLNTETRPWIHGDTTTPRRAGVNSFGFGGINAHVVLEEYIGPPETTLPSRHLRWEHEVVIVEGEDRAKLIAAAERLQCFLKAAPAIELKDLAATLNTTASIAAGTGLRVAFVVASLEELEEKLGRALARIADPACQKIKDVKGIYFFAEPLARTGKLAFLFPGEGAQYANMLNDLCQEFPEVRARFDDMDRLFAHHHRGYLPSDAIFPRPAFGAAAKEEAARRLWQMDTAIEALVTANHALYTLLDGLHITPDAVVGHSTGDFSAMRAAGMLATDGYDERILELNQSYEAVASRGNIPAAALLAVGAGREQVAPLIEALEDVFVAMDNCPHQTVVAGNPDAIEQIAVAMQGRGFMCERLSFDRAYHTPLYEPYAEVVRRSMTEWIVGQPSVPVYSCTTAAPYPADLAQSRAVAHEHWLAPVEFRRTVERMYDDGVRLFVEAGPRGNLTAFVEDTLRGKPFLAVPADVQHRSGITQLSHLVGLLSAHGVPMRLQPLYERRDPQQLDLDAPADPLHTGSRPHALFKLGTGWPPMTLSEDVAATLRRTSVPPAPSFDAVPFVAPPPQREEPPAHPIHDPHLANGTHMANGHSPVDVSSTPIHTGDGMVAPAASAPALAPPPSQPLAAAPQPAYEMAMPPMTNVDAVMTAYMQTMMQFLAVQQEVMQTYLGGTPSHPAGYAAPQFSAPAPQPVPVLAAPMPVAPVLPVVAPVAAVVPVVPVAAPAVAPLGETLLRIVSDKTGYPTDMLDPDLDLEADLGIDSIKRVEILGSLQQETGLQLATQMDTLSGSRTLRTLIAALDQHDATTPAGPEEVRPALPFLSSVASLVEGRTAIVDIELCMDTHPFFRDHTLGRHISATEAAVGLPVMPLTMSMEMLVEAATLLVPDLVPTTLRDIRAYRWISLVEPSFRVRVKAQRRTDAPDVVVQIFEVAAMTPPDAPLVAPIVEGRVEFAPSYPAAPLAASLPLDQETTGRWTPDRLYEEAMFHGPAFRGVRALRRVGRDGAEAEITTLPADGLFGQGGEMLIDPVLLDQPGQVVGFWAAQMLERGYLVFPYRLDALHLYGPMLPPNTPLGCRARIEVLDDHRVRSDLDIVMGDGRLWARFEGWEDRRFDLPSPFYRLLLDPAEAVLASPWSLPAALVGAPAHAFRLGVRDFADELLTAHGGIWQQVLARLVLGAREREQWEALRMPEARRLEWLLARIAAKDAVRAAMRERANLLLRPADVEILSDEAGRPTVGGAWTSDRADVPLISLAHSDGVAVAVAVPAASGGIGIDVEHQGRMNAEIAAVAFDAEEQALLAALPDAAAYDWALRAWCAKEATAKALGYGLRHGPQTVAVHRFDGETGDIHLRPSPLLVEQVPAIGNHSIVAHTAHDGDLVLAAALLGREEPSNAHIS